MADDCDVPYLKILIYNNGSQPFFGPGSDFGQVWYSSLQNENKYGESSFFLQGENIFDAGDAAPSTPFVDQVEYIGTDRIRTGVKTGARDIPIGMVCHPFVIPRDIGDWTALPGDNGVWETTVGYMQPAVERLVQHSQGMNLDGSSLPAPWGRESPYHHPDDPSFSFSIFPLAVSPEYDATAGGIPYVQIAWSDGRWAIRFFHVGNPILLKKFGGILVPVMELASPKNTSYGDVPQELRGIVRVQRKGLMISFDEGATYDVWFEPDQTPVYVPGGKYTFTGQGGASSLGLHQVYYVDHCTYESPENPMEKTRDGNPSYEIVGSALHGTSVGITNIAPTSAAETMQYRLTFNRGSWGGHWTYYYSPEAYVVLGEWPVVPSLSIKVHDNGATMEGRIRTLTIEEPRELDDSTCTWTARYTVAEGGPIGSFAFRPIQVIGGWAKSDGSLDVQVMFTGYISGAKVVQKNAILVDVSFTAQNTSMRPKRMQWFDHNIKPYDGMTLNQSMADWGVAMGLNSTFFALNPIGDFVILPQESYEEPAYMGVAGEPRMDIQHKLHEYARMEFGVFRDGTYTSFQQDAWIVSPHFWQADPIDDSGRIEEIDLEQQMLETFTGVVVRGHTQFGEQIGAWITDFAAEGNIFSNRFRHWPERHVETIEHPVTRYWINTVALGIAYEKLTPKFLGRWKGKLAHFVSRRQTVRVFGTSVGLGTSSTVGIVAMSHTWDRTQGDGAWTEITGQRLTTV